MGKIKSKTIKRATETLMDRHSQEFTTDFNENKRKVQGMVEVHNSKKLRNTIAGFVTRKKRKGQ